LGLRFSDTYSMTEREKKKIRQARRFRASDLYRNLIWNLEKEI
jgi:hypothetical protein